VADAWEQVEVPLAEDFESYDCAAFAIALEPMARRWLTPGCVTFFNKINDPLTKLHRKWLAHQ